MSQSHPDFTECQYSIQRELGRNRSGGRISYLATRLDRSDELVVIKQFRFLQTDSNWQGYKAYEREIQFLQQIDHPRIPKYLDSFATDDGFCMVQEYKNAPNLSERRTFSAPEIKQIALSILEILVDLQNNVPPIVHRDIKPENILVDDRKQAYLIDFGLAKRDREEIAVSSVVAGTPGFIPPEELFNRPLSKASDLYSLGATIICMVTNTRSTDISNLLDDNYRFNFEQLVTGVNQSFVKWLQRMVAPLPRDRFPDAKTAMAALQAIDIEKTDNVFTIPTRYPTNRIAIKFVLAIGIGLGIFVGFRQTRQMPLTHVNNSTATTASNVNAPSAWFDSIKPHCNAVEVATAIASNPPPPDWESTGYAAACYALAGKIEDADRAIASLSPELRPHAVNIVFTIGHPVADAGDDRSAGPIMELVLKYWSQNYMAMYHAGMSAYALGNPSLAKQRLTDFLNTYTVSDGWTSNARAVLDKIDRGVYNGSYPKDP